MNILFIARGYPTNKYKMNGIFEFDQAKALAEALHKVIYAAIDMRSIRRWRKWGFESKVKEGVLIEAVNFPAGRIPKKILNIISELLLKKLFDRIFKKYGELDIIHTHFIGMGYIAVRVFKNSRIPIVHTEHSSQMNQEVLSEYNKYLGNNTYKHLDKVLTVGTHLASNLKDKFGVKSVVVTNIVDITKFYYRISIDNEAGFNFVSVGSLLPNKRMDLLINSFYHVFYDNDKVKLYIYGEGPERKNLERLINKLGLTNQVFLMGLVNRQVIVRKMHESHCFVLISESETFGVAYIEAMSSCLPVIATKCGGPEDFINEENGLIIPVNSIDGLTDAMKYMYENIQKYDKDSISRSIIDQFSPSVIANKLVKIYKELIKYKFH